MTKPKEAIYEKGLLDSELIFALKKKEAELRKESAECNNKIKELVINLTLKKIDISDNDIYLDLNKKRFFYDNTIYHTVGLLQFLTKNKL